MSSSREINNVVSRVNSARTAIADKNTSYQDAAGLSSGRSDIISSIRTANRRLQNKVNSLLTAYGTLNTRLGSLDRAVQTAESKRM